MADHRLTKEHVLPLVNQFVAWAESLHEEEAMQRIKPPLQQYQLGLFRLVVVGEIKKGKSSFINALLGEPDLLPVLTDVATSTVYKIMYGEQKKFKVFFHPTDPGRPDEASPPLEITEAQLREYGTEDGNPDNEKEIDFIAVYLPNPLLKEGVVIVDTPGLGGLFKHHSDITWRYVPNADAVFFVLESVESVASQAEMDCLKRLRQMTPLLFFVQTKIDLVEPEQWQRWRDRNLEIIAQQLQIPQEKLIYFPLSSELKRFADADHSPADLHESGFTPLLYFLHNRLLRVKEEQHARPLLEAMAEQTGNIRRRLADALQVFNTETKEGLDAREREITETETRFEHWQRTEYQPVVTALQDHSSDLKRLTHDRLQNRLDPSPNGQIVGSIMAALRERHVAARHLDEHAGTLQNDCVEMCTQVVFEVLGAYNQGMQHLMTETSRRLGQASVVNVPATIRGVTLQTVERLNMHFSGFEEARNLLYGGLAGATLASYTVGLIFPPLILPGIILGARFAFRDAQKRRQEEALNRMQTLMVDTVRHAQRQATQQFLELVTRYERSAREALQSAASKTQQELQEKRRAIVEAKKQTYEQNRRQAADLEKKLAQANRLLRQITSLVSTSRNPA